MIVNIYGNNFGATDLEAAQSLMTDLSGSDHSNVDFTYISLDKLCIGDDEYDGDEEDYYNNPNYEFPDGGQFVFAAYGDGEIHGIWLITEGNEDFIDAVCK